MVLDENDNAPTFDADLINVSLLEEANVGTRLMKVQATDADAANPAALMQKEVSYYDIDFGKTCFSKHISQKRPIDYGLLKVLVAA